MPCRSDHMEANTLEIALSRVFCLMEELGGKEDMDMNHWAGYHPRAYSQGRTVAELDNATATLCAMLKKDFDVPNFSLEMQMWWRDHQEADVRRGQEEARQKVTASVRKRALAKLTDEEKKALGLKEDTCERTTTM